MKRFTLHRFILINTHTYVEVKSMILLNFAMEIIQEYKNFFEIANINHRFITSLLFFCLLKCSGN
jgi:hypothetical protein